MYPPQRKSSKDLREEEREKRRVRIEALVKQCQSRAGLQESHVPQLSLNDSIPAQAACILIPDPPCTATHTTEHADAAKVEASSVPSVPTTECTWSKFNEYAQYVGELERSSSVMSRKAQQAKYREALRKQVDALRERTRRDLEEQLVVAKGVESDVARWKAHEESSYRARKLSMEEDVRERSRQLEEARVQHAEETKRLETEDKIILDKAKSEIAKEARKNIRRRENLLTTMKSVMAHNEADRLLKQQLKAKAQAADLAAQREFERMLDEKAKQRKDEMEKRLARQKALLKRMEERVLSQAVSKANDDEQRAARQRAEADARALELDRVKSAKKEAAMESLKKTLDQQIIEREERKRADKAVSKELAQAHNADAANFKEYQQSKLLARKQAVSTYSQDLDKQVAERKALAKAVRGQTMSNLEVAMNRKLIEIIDKTLSEKSLQKLKGLRDDDVRPSSASCGSARGQAASG